MITLYEGILADMEDTINSGDSYVKAEKEWSRFIKSDNFKKAMQGIWSISTTNKDIINYLCSDLNVKDTITSLYLQIYTHDAFGCNLIQNKYFKILFGKGSRLSCYATIPYTIPNGNGIKPNVINDAASVKDCLKIVMTNIINDTHITDIATAKELINQYIKL